MRGLYIIFALSIINKLQAQNQNYYLNDSIFLLDSVEIYAPKVSPERLYETKENTIYSCKKNEVLKLSSFTANLTTNNAREVFSRVPGVNIWENDGSGIQINVGVRGLSPNRSWELNTRQNGYDISADVFGYPEAYYNPPLEAVESIELIRGGASLQYGPQFGGVLNYVLKRKTNKKFSFETQNSVRSYNLMSSYNAIGGKSGKFSYYAYNHSRSGDGWRENSSYKVRNSHLFFEYAFTENTRLSAEYTNMSYKMQQAGGLTDDQFKANPRQSLRNRNWFGVPWNVFTLNFDTKIGERFSSNTKLFGLVGERNSVGFTATPNVNDVNNPGTNDLAKRRVDRDLYRNFGLENRNLLKYQIGNIKNNLAFGIRLYRANTIRKQEGRGTTAADYDLSSETKFSRELDFCTNNVAVFAKNQINITDQLSLTPGIRYEFIENTGSGRFGIQAGDDIPFENKDISRSKPLFGIGMQYTFGSTNVYANITQAFRPVLFSDFTPPAVTDIIDPNLKDASGYNADIGYRGSINDYINFDIGLFYLSYNNRIGGIRQFLNNDPTQGTFLFRTNLGATLNKGLESFVNFNLTRFLSVNNTYGNIEIFATMSFIDSKYTDFSVFTTSGSAPNIAITESNLEGNRVENTPEYIHNFGLVWSKSKISASFQYRKTGGIFTDANNTSNPSPNGVTGFLEGYGVIDMSAEYKFLANYNLRLGINNLTNEMYATRRAGGYC
jgi:Fe(3+) dicitrate transport protein